jgi:uncharacterized protein YciI
MDTTMMRLLAAAGLATLAALVPSSGAADAETATPPPAAYDEALARKVGADEHGMRSYVLVILKSGPNPVPKGPERDAMFQGHFANMKRLADEGKLVYAGPLDGVDGWRGLFILNVAEIEEARALVATDPVVSRGEMVPELHKHYGSAALRLVNEAHAKVAKKAM